MIQVHVIYKKLTLIIKYICRLKVNGWGRIYHVNINQKKMEIAMLSSDRADFTAREVVRHREEYLLLLFSCQVMSCRPHGLQHARLLCPLLSPGVCSDSCPLNHWCHPLILCCPLLLLSVFPSIRVFFSESALCFKWPKYWSFSFSISPFSEYLGLISL